jgi:hypothetical protein
MVETPKLKNRESGGSRTVIYYPLFVGEIFGRQALLALPGPVTGAVLGRAVAGFGEFVIRTNAGLRMHAPEQAVV